MTFLKWFVKLAVLPLMLLLKLLEWAGIFLISVSSVVFNLLAGLFFLVGVASYILGLTTGPEALKMIAVGFMIFMIPMIGEWFVTMITEANIGLNNFLKS